MEVSVQNLPCHVNAGIVVPNHHRRRSFFGHNVYLVWSWTIKVCHTSHLHCVLMLLVLRDTTVRVCSCRHRSRGQIARFNSIGGWVPGCQSLVVLRSSEFRNCLLVHVGGLMRLVARILGCLLLGWIWMQLRQSGLTWAMIIWIHTLRIDLSFMLRILPAHRSSCCWHSIDSCSKRLLWST